MINDNTNNVLKLRFAFSPSRAPAVYGGGYEKIRPWKIHFIE